MLKNKKLLILAILLANILLTNCECQKQSEGSEKQGSNSKKDQKPIENNEDPIIKEKEQLILEENQLIANLKKQYKTNSWQSYEKEVNLAKHDSTMLLDIIDGINHEIKTLDIWEKQGIKNISRGKFIALRNLLDSIEGIDINSTMTREKLNIGLEFNQKYIISKAYAALTAHLALCQNLRKQLDLEKAEK